MRTETATTEETVILTRPVGFTHTFTVFPDDMNYAGSLFGGKILAEMDIAAANAARKLLRGTDCEGAVTASLDRVDFKKPAKLGDIIELQANVVGLGRTSIVISVSVNKEDLRTGVVEQICDARFTFIALKDGKPHPHRRILLSEHI